MTREPAIRIHASAMRSAACGLCIVLAVLGACREAPVSATPAATTATSGTLPDVVLIVLDTLRADHLHCYGYGRETSPNLDAFASTATRYEKAWSTAPWTLPSHASMFTGLTPGEHGAHSFKPPEQVNRNAYPLDDQFETITETLRTLGYETEAFVNNIGYLGAWTNIQQGFDGYNLSLVYAQAFMPKIDAWLTARTDRRFFLFINWMDTHRPYNTQPRPGFLNPPAVHEKRSQRNKLLQQLLDAVMAGDGSVPEPLRQQVINQYDTAIANVDEQFGVLMGKLRETGRFDNALIIVTSDHGEYFGEHKLVEHSKDLYQPAVNVPLIVKMPGQTTGRVESQPISGRAIPQIILSALPAPITSSHRTKYPPANGPVIVENYYSRTKDIFSPEWGARFDRIRAAYVDWPLKYIESSDGANELYDLATDPDESENLIETRADDARRLAAVLSEFKSAHPRRYPHVEAPPETPEEREVLDTLGYAGGRGRADDDEGKETP